MRRLLASTLQKGPCLCDGGNSKMDLLCKTSDAARAGFQVGGQARPDRTRRDAAMGRRAANGTEEQPYSAVRYDSPALETPGSCRGEGSEMKGQGHG